MILGIGGLLHDASAALLREGELIAAMEEEKLLRQRHSRGLPVRAIETCLETAGVQRESVEIVALARPLGTGPDPSFQLHLRQLFPNSQLVIVDHHVAHATSAFYPSPFEEAKVVTLDESGDTRCGGVWEAQDHRMDLVEELYSPDSPAAFYSRVTKLLGFRGGSEEHKVQWLSKAGEPRFRDLFLEILGAIDSGRPQLDHSYFDTSRLTRGGFSEKLYSRLSIDSSQQLPQALRADIAASVQSAVEETVLQIAGQGKNLCLAGGLMLNALLVEAIERSGRFEQVWVQPVAGNAGTSVGAAYHAWHHTLRHAERKPVKNLFLGPQYDREQIKLILENCKLRFRYLMTDEQLVGTAVERLVDNQIVAWFQGRIEFGSRALGSRSIFASPLNPYSTENLNVYIKHREPFRKFAASVPEEIASEYFDCSPNARYLTTVSRVRDTHRKTFEAALLDGERVRVHTVRREDSPLTWQLLHKAGQVSGLPVLYNTSFNLFGEPLVCDPRAAVRSFYASGIDAMLVGHFLLEK